MNKYSSFSEMDTNHSNSKKEKVEQLTRRDWSAAVAAMGFGALLASGGKAQAQAQLSSDAMHVLLERVMSARLSAQADGSYKVSGTLWPEELGYLDHQDWLFNPQDGLQRHPAEALSKSLLEPNGDVHDGVTLDEQALQKLQEMLNASIECGFFDDYRPIYEAVRARLEYNYNHGIEHGLLEFETWLMQQEDTTDDVKTQMKEKLAEFRARPLPQSDHDGY